MKRLMWRSYPVQNFRLAGIYLQDDGRVIVNAHIRIRRDDPIDEKVGEELHLTRPEGVDQFLIIQQPGRIPQVFRYRDGVWERWVRMFRVGRWRFWFHDIVRTWGMGTPLYLLAKAVTYASIIYGIYLAFEPDTPGIWIIACIAFLVWLFWP